jgi:hypothetical protein
MFIKDKVQSRSAYTHQLLAGLSELSFLPAVHMKTSKINRSHALELQITSPKVILPF